MTNDESFKTLARLGCVLLRPRVRDGEVLDGDDPVTELIEGSTRFRTE